ncbi:iron dicitrate transport regulator FecR [Babesia caballi]|uniref:Iron dicitrate transport regulator FecR n=1 Tax=Babesia caballi TaxID=5871 RepID=A0AAV4LPF7_BABCB|nr:iron dicitrate transport regulator FecR [Babesia caballi]
MADDRVVLALDALPVGLDVNVAAAPLPALVHLAGHAGGEEAAGEVEALDQVAVERGEQPGAARVDELADDVVDQSLLHGNVERALGLRRAGRRVDGVGDGVLGGNERGMPAAAAGGDGGAEAGAFTDAARHVHPQVVQQVVDGEPVAHRAQLDANGGKHGHLVGEEEVGRTAPTSQVEDDTALVHAEASHLGADLLQARGLDFAVHPVGRGADVVHAALEQVPDAVVRDSDAAAEVVVDAAELRLRQLAVVRGRVFARRRGGRLDWARAVVGALQQGSQRVHAVRVEAGELPETQAQWRARMLDGLGVRAGLAVDELPALGGLEDSTGCSLADHLDPVRAIFELNVPALRA